LKGKAEPVPAFRLLRVRDAPERPHTARFVGRDHELAILREAWERVEEQRRCELVTVIGDAGVGKSRLASELLGSIEATVVQGRCPPYGEGITYWPVVEVLKQLDVSSPEEAVVVAIRSLLGESDVAASSEEIAWAFRKTLEHAAAEGPLVVVFDDIQWGERTFHDLIEHVALLSSEASILLLCMARPELSGGRPTWPVTLRLEPLPDEDVEELIAERVPGDLRTKIARAAAGNPLFIEEMVAMAGDRDGEVVVPPTLQSLLAARLDQLEPAERSVLERGAIEGEIFHRGAVRALALAETQVTPNLAALVRKELIRPDRPQLAGEDGFRFRHLLIRDAAYDSLPKATRAELHERLASWLDQRGSELVELDEIVGYHLEQACRYRDELGLAADDELTGAARRRLTSAGFRARFRSDHGAAVNLLGRAAALMPPGRIELALETELVDALYWSGRGAEALQHADALAERAAAAGDHVGELCGRIQAGLIRSDLEPEGATERLEALLVKALPVLEAARDDLSLCLAYEASAFVEFIRARGDAALRAFDRAAKHARHAGLPHQLLGWRATSRLNGSMPVVELLTWLDENDPREGRDNILRVNRAVALSMLGQFDDARAILAEVRTELADRGGGVQLGTITGIESAEVELLAGDPSTAAELAAEGCRQLEELGAQSYLSTAAGTLARALYALDRLDEAYAWTGRAEELGASDDAFTQLVWRQVRAKVLARRGQHAESERLAREAVAIGEGTEFVSGQGDANADLAEVLLLAGRVEEAAEALEVALARYERKGNVVMVERMRDRLEGLREETRKREL
jgi:tetratricopeptide (TPR) repeat protein